MEGIITNYRRGRRTMRGNQMIVEVDGFDSRSKAAQLIGKRVLWLSPAKKEIHGKIVDVHGNSGAVRARFNRGMPGQAIGNKIAITDKGAKKEAPKKAAPKAREAPLS
ncbi:50S ribosomal protein L35ae, partial [archaeon]